METKKCNSCGTNENPISIPYVVYESSMDRMERIVKRQWIALIVTLCMLFGSFAGFIWYESQFETISYEQDGEGINNVNLGEQGDLNNGTKSQVQEEKEK